MKKVVSIKFTRYALVLIFLKKRVSVIWAKAYRNTTDSLVGSGSKVQHEVGGIEGTNETQCEGKALSSQCNERSDLPIFLI